jgi:hypothetical protein
MSTNSTMAYEVLVRTWRPLSVGELQGAIRELCAAKVDADELMASLDGDPQFTRDAMGRYGLEEYRWRMPGDFRYVEVNEIG